MAVAITVQAHAKINWALDITGRRADGYHEMVMLMQSIALADELSLELSDGLSMTVDGGVPEDVDSNLVMRAAAALRRHTGTELGARMALTKHVPARAGLGGGSADCAAALKELNRLWGLGLDDGTLAGIGLTLGADVPFCLAGGLARVSGIGELIDPIPGAPEIPLVLCTPGGGLSTGEVFRTWDRSRTPVSLDVDALASAVVARDLSRAGKLSVNALTAPAIALMPEIGSTMERMHKLGAGAVFMSGSGSTVVGAFETGKDAMRASAALPGSVVTHTLGET